MSRKVQSYDAKGRSEYFRCKGKGKQSSFDRQATCTDTIGEDGWTFEDEFFCSMSNDGAK